MKQCRFFTAAALLVLVTAGPVVARDGLYAPSRPEDAALVRVANMSEEVVSRPIDIGPVRFEAREPLSVGPYRPVPLGVYTLFDPENTVFTPEPRSFVTIVAGHGPDDSEELIVFPDTPHEDPARAQIVVYNLTDVTVDLRVAGSGATVIGDVSPGTSDSIAVNAVTVELAVNASAGDSSMSSVPGGALSLQRGASYGIFVLSRGNDHTGETELLAWMEEAVVVVD